MLPLDKYPFKIVPFAPFMHKYSRREVDTVSKELFSKYFSLPQGSMTEYVFELRPQE